MIDEELKEAARRNAEMISGSKVFMCLFNEHMVEEVIPLLQMGLAIYMDKPIALLVPEGVRVPHNLQKLADGNIEYYRKDDEQSVTDATTRLMITMAGLGRIG